MGKELFVNKESKITIQCILFEDTNNQITIFMYNIFLQVNDDHAYCLKGATASNVEELEHYKSKVADLEMQIAQLKLSTGPFTIEKIKHDNKKVCLYF